MVDFTNCRTVIGRAYNGAGGKKIAVEYEGNIYMLKFPQSGEGKRTALSYTNSSVSEHIGSSIFRMLGVPAQETLLGTYRVGEKVKVVCACRDFVTEGKRFFDFCSVKNTILDSESAGTGMELMEILETIEKQKFVPPEEAMEHFWNVFVVDALLGNFDRHNGNWGFLFDPVTGTAEIAPIYDCGSCLLPQADEAVMRSVLENKEALDARLFQFPSSAVRIGNKKISYYDFLIGCENEDCMAAVRRMVGRMDMDKISAFLDRVPYLSDLQREFYKTYLMARYDEILVPAYEAVLDQEQEMGLSM